MFATTGLVVAQPLGGMIAVRRGGRATAISGTIFYAGGPPLAAAAPSVALLAAVLFVMGLANGVLDVAVNVMGVSGERRAGRRMLASMHAALSFGVMTGADRAPRRVLGERAPTTGPTASAIADTPARVPIALPHSSGGKAFEMIDRVQGIMKAAPAL